MKNGPFRFQFHKTTGSPSNAKSPHKRTMGDKRPWMLRAKTSDISVVKQPWNLSNAQTSAPSSNNGGLVEKQGGLQGSSESRRKRAYILIIFRENMTMSMASLLGSSLTANPSITQSKRKRSATRKASEPSKGISQQAMRFCSTVIRSSPL